MNNTPNFSSPNINTPEAAINAPTNNFTPDLGITGKTHITPQQEIIPGTTPGSARMMAEEQIKDDAANKSTYKENLQPILDATKPAGKWKDLFEGIKQEVLNPVMAINQGGLRMLAHYNIVNQDMVDNYDTQVALEQKNYQDIVSAHKYWADAGNIIGAIAPYSGALKAVRGGVALAGGERIAAKAATTFSPRILKGMSVIKDHLEMMTASGLTAGMQPVSSEEYRRTLMMDSAIGAGILGVPLRLLGATPAAKKFSAYTLALKGNAANYISTKIANALNAIGITGKAIGDEIISPSTAVDTARFWYATKRMGITPEELMGAPARAKTAEEIGAPTLTAGALTRSPAAQIQEKSLLRSSQQFANIYNSIGYDLYMTSQNMLKSFDGLLKAPVDLPDVGKNLQNFLTKNYWEARNSVGNVYQHLSDTPGAEIELPLSKIADTFNFLNEEEKQPVYNKEVNSFIQKFNDRLHPKDREPSSSPIVAAGGNAFSIANPVNIQNPTTTVGELNNFITEINKYQRKVPANKYDTNAALNSLRRAAYQTYDYIADDVSNPARQLFDAARNARREIHDVFEQKDLVNDIVTFKEKLTPKIGYEELTNKIFGSRITANDLDRIENALKFLPKTPEAITSADIAEKVNPDGLKLWDSLRGNAINQILNKYTQDINGTPTLMPRGLLNDFQNREYIYKKILGDNLYDKYSKFMDVLDYWSNRAKGATISGASALSNAARNVAHASLHVGRYGGHNVVGAILYPAIRLAQNVWHEFSDPKKVADNLLISQMIKNMKEIPTTKYHEESKRLLNDFINNIAGTITLPQGQMPLETKEEK